MCVSPKIASVFSKIVEHTEYTKLLDNIGVITNNKAEKAHHNGFFLLKENAKHSAKRKHIHMYSKSKI